MKKDELSQFISVRSSVGGVAGCFLIPITFLIWMTWFTQADGYYHSFPGGLYRHVHCRILHLAVSDVVTL